MKKPTIILKNDQHNNQAVISLKFQKDQMLISRLKTLSGIKWSQRRNFWYVPVQDFNLSKAFETLQPVVFIDYSALKDSKTQPQKKKQAVEIPVAFKNLSEQKRYAKNTKSIYLSYFADFIRYYKNKKPEEMSKAEINDYILHLIRTGNISPGQQNQRINAIKFYYEKVLGRQNE